MSDHCIALLPEFDVKFSRVPSPHLSSKSLYRYLNQNSSLHASSAPGNNTPIPMALLRPLTPPRALDPVYPVYPGIDS